MDEVRNRKWTRDEFESVRSEILTQWPTGKDVDLEEAFSYHQNLPDHKIFSFKLNKAKQENKTLVQPRAGVPLIPEMIELLKYLQDVGEADLLPTTIDSYTRQNRYNEAEVGIKESERTGKAMLNGFPAVNHGVAGCRMLIDALDTPLQIRHGTPTLDFRRRSRTPAGIQATKAAESPTISPTRKMYRSRRRSATGSMSIA